jgi:(p)ppGpp synthase/HD superfamily hydrolase
MAERLETTARRAGIDEPGVARIVNAFHEAMGPRDGRLDDDHHPDYLHPARTALILMDDLGVTDPTQIAAGVLLESLRPELEATSTDTEARALAERIPTPARDGELFVENLVSAETPVRLIALAERLDQVRHLHLHDREEWVERHHETTSVYLPVAVRTHPTLARRFRWWSETFQRRFLAEITK